MYTEASAETLDNGAISVRRTLGLCNERVASFYKEAYGTPGYNFYQRICGGNHYIAFYHIQNTARITGSRQRILGDHLDTVTDMQFLLDGSKLASASLEAKAIL